MSDLEPERFRPLLRGGLGDPYLHVVETSSTQDLLRAGSLPHGAVAVAEHQTAGRGRSGRYWDDAPSTALLCSVLLRPPADAAQQELSIVVGLAVAAAVEREAAVPALVRWPNDVLVKTRKVAGILLEASEGAVVCGIGINVNQTTSELPPDATDACNVASDRGRPVVQPRHRPHVRADRARVALRRLGRKRALVPQRRDRAPQRGTRAGACTSAAIPAQAARSPLTAASPWCSTTARRCWSGPARSRVRRGEAHASPWCAARIFRRVARATHARRPYESAGQPALPILPACSRSGQSATAGPPPQDRCLRAVRAR